MEEDIQGQMFSARGSTECHQPGTSAWPQQLLLSTQNPPLLQFLFLNNGPFGIFQSHHGTFWDGAPGEIL